VRDRVSPQGDGHESSSKRRAALFQKTSSTWASVSRSDQRSLRMSGPNVSSRCCSSKNGAEALRRDAGQRRSSSGLRAERARPASGSSHAA